MCVCTMHSPILSLLVHFSISPPQAREKLPHLLLPGGRAECPQAVGQVQAEGSPPLLGAEGHSERECQEQRRLFREVRGD